MNLERRMELMEQLGRYMISDDPGWKLVRQRAFEHNPWFLPFFIESATRNIAASMLDPVKLCRWTAGYPIPSNNESPKQIGLVLAGNIPLVGFHDLLSVFITGNKALIKQSSRDPYLLKHLTDLLVEWEPSVLQYISYADRLNDCDAYIATGSNNSFRYFEYYFSKYPHIIRKNRTSVAVIEGQESGGELDALADDVHLYFGLGCRNVTKIYVPEGYDFKPLLEAFGKYDFLMENHKYRHNYDYNLALHMLNRTFYMTNGSSILSENKSLFSPIGELFYEYYDGSPERQLQQEAASIQCVVGKGRTPFGIAQSPEITDYADGIDTVQFLLDLDKTTLVV